MEPTTFGRRTSYGLVLAAWATVVPAILPWLLDHRMDGPSGLGWLVILGAVFPLAALPSIFLVSVTANYLAFRNPGRWRAPGWKPVVWALAASVAGPLLTFPMLMSNRAPARTTASRAEVGEVVTALAGAWDRARGDHLAPEALPGALGAAVAKECAQWRNPFSPGQRAFDPAPRRLEGLDAPAITPALETLAQETGCVVTAYQMPQGTMPGFVAAAVRFPGRGQPYAWAVKWTLVE